jgi:membrane-associated phospholipid phosphatase
MQTVARGNAGIVVRERDPAFDRWTIPVLEAAPRGPAASFAALFRRGRHPSIVFFTALLGGFVVLVGLSVAAGVLFTHVLMPVSAVGDPSRRFELWLATHRTPTRTDASLIGSIMAGGVVLPILVGIIGGVFAALRQWRIAAFAVFGLILESATYRASTLMLHERRPHVARLESLPVNASYPSGHTAASIAVYAGLVLLLTSKIGNLAFRVCAWSLAAAIPVYVGLSRMYRGMHYPLDVTGGALLGIAALAVIVFACRAAGSAAQPERGRVTAS